MTRKQAYQLLQSAFSAPRTLCDPQDHSVVTTLCLTPNGPTPDLRQPNRLAL